MVGNLFGPCRVDDQLRLVVHHRVRHFKVGVNLPSPKRSHSSLKLLDGSEVPLDELDSHLSRSLPRQLGGLAR